MRGKSDVHPDAPWCSATAVATMLHGGALAAAVLWHASAPPPPPPAPPAAMMIELAPMAAPAAPTDKAPGIEQEAARPIEKAVQEPPKPEPVKKAEVPLPQPKPRPKPRPAPPVEAPPAEKVVEQTTAPAAAEAPTAPKTAAPTLGSVSAAPSNAVPTWQGALRAHLERHKRYPSAAQFRRQEGVAYVRFSMKRDGSVLSARLERASGFSRLDDEALALLDRAQPLPLPPPEVMGEVIDIVVPIQFFLRSTGS